MLPSFPLVWRQFLEGPLMANPSNLDALPIICQEDIDSPPLPPPIRWGGCKDIWRMGSLLVLLSSKKKSSLLRMKREKTFSF
ncbi:hypothetical protein CEXT_494331 [Caerostris extrusa]|uniref:Uncharacterized protein n=1 Tax=Caerostris extrusa TaxID=172846 RepID=A0AAV4YD12_CAEEX|nr:hypothetical protein CEXT_494331 [Caerostris extrusa]